MWSGFLFNTYLSFVEQYDVIIIGGGLAGLTAAIDLYQRGYVVLVLEKKKYPHHKVCGEYVSNEILPYMNKLGVSLSSLSPMSIDTLQLSTVDGKSITTALPLGGLGISRYAFDHALFKRATSIGVHFIFDTVVNIEFYNTYFKVITDSDESYTSNNVIGAYGKRSPLDKHLNRDFISRKSSWLGVKAHYAFEKFPENKVALHNFEGGYAGLSKTESGAVNFCYLTSYQSFQKEKNVDLFNKRVVAKNQYLSDFLEKAVPIFEEPLTIAQISFEQKKTVENHILMCGDTAGLIHPLCGNGMAMAIHAAKIASDQIDFYMKNSTYTREQLEKDYAKQWDITFKKRIWMGRQLQRILLSPKLSKMVFQAVTTSPTLLRKMIKMTHGKPISC